MNILLQNVLEMRANVNQADSYSLYGKSWTIEAWWVQCFSFLEKNEKMKMIGEKEEDCDYDN